jgi:hypothetical protein
MESTAEDEGLEVSVTMDCEFVREGGERVGGADEG